MKRILIIEDDTGVGRSLQKGLEDEGFAVVWKNTGAGGAAHAAATPPHLILLDVRLPDGLGFDFCRQMRQTGLRQPILMLTVEKEETDKVIGLEVGADDYITKPFEFDVLLAHIKAVLRRTAGLKDAASPLEIINCGDLRIDVSAHQAVLKGEILNLAPKEFEVLSILASNAGKVIASNDILARVWGAEYEGQPQVVYVHIRWLREKLNDTSDESPRIQTVRGIGYKYNPKELA